jgi:hemerythrin
MELDPLLLTGHELIDEQHRELFQRISSILTASHERRGREAVGGLLEYLGEYVVEHFEAEERVMNQADYPGREAHRAEHQLFLRDFVALRQEFLAEGPGSLFVIRVNNRVTTWLRDHLYRTDRDMGVWLRSHPDSR